MGKIYLGTNEIKKIYLGATEIKKVYKGSTEIWSSGPVLPSWFPQNVNGPADLQTYFGTDLSPYFIDVLDRSGQIYQYTRCYCNTINSARLYTNNVSPPTQLFFTYSVNNSRVATRTIAYTSNGTYYNRYNDNWRDYAINILSPGGSIFNPSVCIIDWGNTTFTTSAPSGYSFEILTA